MDKIPEINWAMAATVTELRLKARLTQEQLAGLAGLSKDYISNIERGVQAGSILSIFHIASALGLPASDLIKSVEKAAASNPKPPCKKPGNPRRK